MKTKYEYDVVAKRPYGTLTLKAKNREEAREGKRELKESGIDTEIIQRKYVLAEERVVR